MTSAHGTVSLVDAPRARWRPLAVRAGQVVLALLLLWLWKLAADRAGDAFFAQPAEVWTRVVDMARSGELWRHTYATLRISAIGFALGCFFGVLLPFLLRLVPRFTAAVEPYIMASVGIPKYALIPLFILWFGIDDAPKLWLIGLLVFYPLFIAVFAGIRSVDGRLVSMARVAGASEAWIAREVVWNSLLPFCFAGLRISLPRAVSAALIGEFLVGNEGIGWYIEHSRQQMDVTGAFTGVLVATALVLVINAALVWIDQRANAWRPVDREMQI